MRFSALLCCSSADLRKTHSETDTQAARKFLPSAVSFICSYLSATILTRRGIQDYTTTTYSISAPPVPKTSSISSKKSKHEPYTAHLALELFKTYADEDASDVI